MAPTNINPSLIIINRTITTLNLALQTLIGPKRITQAPYNHESGPNNNKSNHKSHEAVL